MNLIKKYKNKQPKIYSINTYKNINKYKKLYLKQKKLKNIEHKIIQRRLLRSCLIRENLVRRGDLGRLLYSFLINFSLRILF